MYAAFYIPRLMLQAALRFGPDGSRVERLDTNEAVVVTDQTVNKPVVLDLTRTAGEAGVVVGISIPQAVSRCPEVMVRHRSEKAERSLGDLLFHAAYSVSPRVERWSDDVCFVDLRGVAKKGLHDQCATLVAELKASGVQMQVGIAASCSLAGLAARYATGVSVFENLGEEEERREAAAQALAGFLDSLPIGAEAVSEKLADVLEKWGVRSLGAFARMKRDAIGARLGAEGLALWDRVNGREDKVIGVTDLPPSYEEEWEFEYDIESVDPLLFMLKRFLAQLSAKLRVGNKVAAKVEIELGLAYGEPLLFRQKMPEPTADEEALFRLASGRLDGLEAESPVVRISVRIDPVEFKQRQMGLFESSVKNPLRFAQTLSRLAGIVGAENVGRPVLAENGRPDGFELEDLPSSAPANGLLSLEHNYGMPLKRIRPKQEARVEIQGRQPNWFQSERASGFVKACRGPWLHSGEWWEEGSGWNRVEWDVELNKGGVYRLVKEQGKWYLEGEYD